MRLGPLRNVQPTWDDAPVPSHRDHRLNPGGGAGVHVALAEIAVVGKQLANLAKFGRQFCDLAQHRLKLLLVVRRLHHIGGHHQQAVRCHRRLGVVALLEPAAPENPTPIEAMRHKLQTKEGKKRYALRKQTPEPVFGIIKSVIGFRQFMLRGLDKVRGSGAS